MKLWFAYEHFAYFRITDISNSVTLKLVTDLIICISVNWLNFNT